MKLPFFVLLALLLANAVGCREPARSPGDPIVIRFASIGNAQEIENIQKTFDAFEAKHPGIRMELVHAVQNYEQVLLTLIAGGRAPDVFIITPPVIRDYTERGILMNIQERAEASDAIDLDDFFPQTLEPYRFDGEQFGRGDLYGLCKDWSPDRLVFYNKDLFDEAGIPYPDGTWTREEFVEVARRLTRRDAQGRVTRFGVYNNCEAEQWIAQSGGSVWSDDGLRCTLASPESLRGLQFAADLSLRHRVAPNLAEMNQATDMVMFQTGRAAMAFYGMWLVPQFTRNITDFEWDVTTPPRDERDVYLALGMVGYGIYAKTRHPEEAWLFFEHLAGEWGQEFRARAGWNIPASQGVAYSDTFAGNPDFNTDVIAKFLDAIPRTEYVGANPNISPNEYLLHFTSAWESVLLGERTVEEAMRSVAATLDQAIIDNRRLMGKEVPG